MRYAVIGQTNDDLKIYRHPFDDIKKAQRKATELHHKCPSEKFFVVSIPGVTSKQTEKDFKKVENLSTRIKVMFHRYDVAMSYQTDEFCDEQWPKWRNNVETFYQKHEHEMAFVDKVVFICFGSVFFVCNKHEPLISKEMTDGIIKRFTNDERDAFKLALNLYFVVIQCHEIFRDYYNRYRASKLLYEKGFAEQMFKSDEIETDVYKDRNGQKGFVVDDKFNPEDDSFVWQYYDDKSSNLESLKTEYKNNLSLCKATISAWERFFDKYNGSFIIPHHVLLMFNFVMNDNLFKSTKNDKDFEQKTFDELIWAMMLAIGQKVPEQKEHGIRISQRIKDIKEQYIPSTPKKSK